jgi:putrescine aminotransferase
MDLLSIADCEALTAEEVREMYKEYVSPGLENVLYRSAAGEDLIQQAEGVWMTTRSGRRILDVTGGIGVLSLGHNHPRILAARIAYQQNQRMEVHKTFFSPYVAALSHNITQVLPGDLDLPYFCNSGAEAVEGAMKLAYKFHEGKRSHILHADISFHGKLLGSGGMTNVTDNSFKFLTIPGIKSFEYNNLDSVRELVRELRQENGESDVYAIIYEAFNAVTLTQVTPEFMTGLRQICDEHGILLIIDEVFSGWCKTGSLFKFMEFDILPDILTTSKSFGGGKASISAYVARKPVLLKAYGNASTATLHTTTYNGFGEECATAIEAINVMIEEDFVGKSREIDRLVKEKGKVLQEKYPDVFSEVRGSGSLHGVFFKPKDGIMQNLLSLAPVSMLKDPRFLTKITVASIVDWLYKKHDIFTLSNSNRGIGVLFSPSLIITETEIDQFF